ncbi:clarin-1 isoform X1 [Cyprinodon tularosa]|uniref:clarin-1 isoform X1 n=1 Tax=Cyprinodon tularosa TaxID=77115 RepID=UPI0018E1F370|nr:clarin-1 isoform X1 [Cyprinodon tularosa]
MPNRQKQVLFCSAGILSLCCALSAAVISGLPFWLRGSVLCRTGAELVNATGAELDQFVGDLSYGLFHGERVKQCGLGGRPSRFSFFPDLMSVIPAGLHVTIIFFCSVVVLFSSVASGFFFFNAFGRPYETLQGPMGLYLWTCICSGLTSCLVLILFASEVKIRRLSELIANFKEENFVFQTYSESYDSCFWVFFIILVLHGLNLVLIRLTGIQFPFQGKKDVELSVGAADLMY